MPFSQKDTTDLERFHSLVGGLADLDLRNRLFAVQQQRQAKIRQATSDIVSAYASAMGQKREVDVTTPQEQFGGIEATQSKQVTGLEPQQERSLAAETYGKLSAIDPDAATGFTNFRKIFKEETPLELEQVRQTGRLQIEGMREKARAPYYDYLKQKAEDQNSYNQGRLKLATEHEAAWEDIKKQYADVFTMDSKGGIKINPKAPQDKKIKMLIAIENAQRQASQAIQMGKAIDPNDPYVNRVGKNFDAMQGLYEAIHKDVVGDQQADDYTKLTDDELLQMGESGDTKADDEFAKRHPEHTK